MTQVLIARAAHELLPDLPFTEHEGSRLKRERVARICAGAAKPGHAPCWRQTLHRLGGAEMLDAVHVAWRGTFDRRAPSDASGLRCGGVTRLIFSARSCHVRVIKGVADCKAGVEHVREVCRAPLTAAEWRPKMFGPRFQIFRLPFPAGETIAQRHNLTNEGRVARRAAQDGARHFVGVA